ncbi:hypothetical protein GCM10023187_55820 [Nibrella viscosa]|uniref:DUF2892 domain-containing protein n=1 Tax=Nibrella viscosa TaxID=1084524 RepID=A0ABP8L0R5_9BACT
MVKNWNIMRIVRLVAGVAILWSAYANNQPLLGLLGGLLLIQGALNVGCGPAGCRIPKSEKRSVRNAADNSVKDVRYEEI